MRERLVDLGIWIMRNPGEVVEFVIVFWCVASVIALAVLFLWARRDTTTPRAPGLRSRRVG